MPLFQLSWVLHASGTQKCVVKILISKNKKIYIFKKKITRVKF